MRPGRYENVSYSGNSPEIGSSLLRNRHLVRQIQMHLETKFNKHRPVNIQSIMDKSVLDIDTAQPLEKYFERQQQCQLLLTSGDN
jgi:hypothetical protein